MRTDRAEDRWRECLAGRGSRTVPGRKEGDTAGPLLLWGLHGRGRAHAEDEWGQELALTSMVLSSDPTLLRRPRFPAPTSKEEPSVRAATLPL